METFGTLGAQSLLKGHSCRGSEDSDMEPNENGGSVAHEVSEGRKGSIETWVRGPLCAILTNKLCVLKRQS